MNSIYLSLLLFFVIMGPIVIISISLKYSRFWTLLIFVVISAGGVMINGYCLIDKYLIGCLLFGVLLVFSVRPVCQRHVSQKKSRFSKIHFQVFLLFMYYMIFQSIRGLVVLDDLRMVQFIIFFTMLGILSYILYKGFFPVPSHKNIIKIVLFSTLIYFTLYLGHGVLTELIRGMGRFDVQGEEWAGSSVAMFPVFTAIPAVYYALKRKSKQILLEEKDFKQTCLVWATVIIIAATSFYYDSRISWIAITGFLLLSVWDLGIFKSVKVLVIFLVSLFILSVGKMQEHNFIAFITRAGSFFEELFISGLGAQPSDMSRRIEIVAGFQSITDSIQTLFFGTGFYTERYKLIPYYLETASQYLMPTGVIDIIRPATFTSLLSGTGLVGILFLFLCFFLTACEIIEYTKDNNREGRKILLFTLLLVFMSINISLNFGLILFYFCIMPSGLLIQMSKYETS